MKNSKIHFITPHERSREAKSACYPPPWKTPNYPPPWKSVQNGEPRTSKFSLNSNVRNINLGWLKELPDMRDHDLQSLKNGSNKNSEQARLLAALKSNKGKANIYLWDKIKTPARIDLRKTDCFTAIENQGSLGSCTANAVIGLVEFLIKRASGDDIDLSRIFLYKVTRNLLGFLNDDGAYIRTTIKAMRMFGVPPAQWWPYVEDESFNDEPDAFIYSMAENFKSISYLRLDGNGQDGTKSLDNIKRSIADGFPVAFGFTVYSSIYQVSQENPVIPFPAQNDTVEGGHAVLAVGYDDKKQALLIRNSWGHDWGDAGYAWLPFEYVLYGAASDFWTILNNDFVLIKDFSFR